MMCMYMVNLIRLTQEFFCYYMPHAGAKLCSNRPFIFLGRTWHNNVFRLSICWELNILSLKPEALTISIYIYIYIHIHIHIQSCRVCVSVPDFGEKRADRFPWNFSRFIGIIRRLERKKDSGKFQPLNGAKLPISTRYAVEKRHWGLRTGNVSNVTLATWPRANFMNQTFMNLDARSNWQGRVSR